MPYKSTEKQREYLKQYRKKNPNYHSDWGAAKRKELVDFLGGHCKHCSNSDIRVLQVDHVHGGGIQESKRYSHNRRQFNNDILNGVLPKENYQILCANCNWIKRFTNKECKPKNNPL